MSLAVAYWTEIGSALGPESETVNPNGVVPLFPSASATSLIARLGAPSLSTIVPVAVPSRIDAPVAPLSWTVNVSVGSPTRSPTIGTLIVLEV